MLPDEPLASVVDGCGRGWGEAQAVSERISVAGLLRSAEQRLTVHKMHGGKKVRCLPVRTSETRGRLGLLRTTDEDGAAGDGKRLVRGRRLAGGLRKHSALPIYRRPAEVNWLRTTAANGRHRSFDLSHQLSLCPTSRMTALSPG